MLKTPHIVIFSTPIKPTRQASRVLSHMTVDVARDTRLTGKHQRTSKKSNGNSGVFMILTFYWHKDEKHEDKIWHPAQSETLVGISTQKIIP